MASWQCREVRKVPVIVTLNLKRACQCLLFHTSQVYHTSSEKRLARSGHLRRSPHCNARLARSNSKMLARKFDRDRQERSRWLQKIRMVADRESQLNIARSNNQREETPCERTFSLVSSAPSRYRLQRTLRAPKMSSTSWPIPSPPMERDRRHLARSSRGWSSLRPTDTTRSLSRGLTCRSSRPTTAFRAPLRRTKRLCWAPSVERWISEHIKPR